MLKLKIEVGSLNVENGLDLLFQRGGTNIWGTGVFHSWKNTRGVAYFLLGDVFGIRQADGSLLPPSQLKVETDLLENPNRISEVEGRFVLVAVSDDGVC